MDLIAGEGLAAVAVHALRDLPGHREQPYFAWFRHVTLTTQMRAMAADTAAAPALTALAAAGVPTAVVKGPAMAALHPEGWPRLYNDIDLVVTPETFTRTIGCFRSLGFTTSERAIPQWGWFDLRCREGVNLHSPAGGNLDVHHHVPPWTFASGVRADDILRRSEPAELCGTPVRFGCAGDLLLIERVARAQRPLEGKGRTGLLARRAGAAGPARPGSRPGGLRRARTWAGCTISWRPNWHAPSPRRGSTDRTSSSSRDPSSGRDSPRSAGRVSRWRRDSDSRGCPACRW